jgi:hypothetical protein
MPSIQDHVISKLNEQLVRVRNLSCCKVLAHRAGIEIDWAKVDAPKSKHG